MTIRQIIDIVIGGIMILLIATIIILSCVIDNLNKKNIILKQEKNYLSQTIQDMKSENKKQAEIYAEKDRLLIKVKKSNFLQEYLEIWKEINDSIK